MNWFIVNGISAGLAIAFLCIFFMITRKLLTAISYGRRLARQIKLASAGLEQAFLVLYQQQKVLHNEKGNLDKMMRESTRIRNDIRNSFSHMEQMYSHLQKKIRQMEITSSLPVQPGYMPVTPGKDQTEQRMKDSLPVFVRRKVSKASLSKTIKL